MPDITISVTIPNDLVQRVSTATGATTKEQMEAWVKQKIKQQVIDSESSAAELAQRQVAEAEENKITSAKIAAETKADSEIVIT
jgi:CO dehydrogenase/acetyl-CoA synthase beta subunit